MESLVLHVVQPVVSHPDAVRLQTVELEEATILEMMVHADDRAAFDEEDGRLLRAVRTVVSAAAGRRKATVELVEAFSEEE